MNRLHNRRKKRAVRLFFAVIVIAAVAVLIVLIGRLIHRSASPNDSADGETGNLSALHSVTVPDWVTVDVLEEGCSSRRGIELEAVRNIVVHYVGNPGSTAKQNRDYFASDGVEVNAHFVVGLDGEVIQCMPLYERSSASNWRNKDTISIEVCHVDKTGKFSEKTMKSLIKLTAWLCKTCDLGSQDVIRHYDVTGKKCPLYFVEHPDAWDDFRQAVDKQLR